MKSGKKAVILLGLCVLGYAMGSNALHFRRIKKTQRAITWIQYLNRLEEFCINDIEQSKIYFVHLIEDGISLEEAFNMTVYFDSLRDSEISKNYD